MVSGSGGEGPFDCANCGEKDKEARNCFNRLLLSEEARAVSNYSETVKEELSRREAKKVFSVGNVRLYECPLSFISRDTLEVMELLYLIEGSGHLLHAGGLGAQPAWLVEAFTVYKLESLVKKKDNSNG